MVDVQTFWAQSGVLEFMDMAINAVMGRGFSFPWMSNEDIKSELRLSCIEAAHKFDPTRIGHFPYNFFLTCARNKFYNIGRGTVFTNNPPCNRCDEWDKKSKTCRINEVGCEEIIRHREGMKKKLGLKNPPSCDSMNFSLVDKKTEKLNLYDIADSLSCIREIVPDDLEKDFNKLIDGEKISKKSLNRLRALILEYLSDEYN